MNFQFSTFKYLKQISNSLFFLFPIIKFKIKEKSMEPGIREGNTILVSRYHYFFRKPKVGEVVVMQNRQKYIIKRISKVGKDTIFVVGDNLSESIDSRKFGWISKGIIVGKVIKTFLFFLFLVLIL